MPAPTVDADADRLFDLLAPELRKLCNNFSPFCDLTLIATLHDSELARVALGITTSRKVSPRSDRGSR